MNIKAGSKWLCIKDFEYRYSGGTICYIKGITYSSRCNGCISDESDNPFIRWENIVMATKYFIPVSNKRKFNKVLGRNICGVVKHKFNSFINWLQIKITISMYKI